MLHAPVLDTADRNLIIRETVRAVAAQHGAVAAFAPKPFPTQAGSGMQSVTKITTDLGDHIVQSAIEQGRWRIDEIGYEIGMTIRRRRRHDDSEESAAA